MAQKTTLIRKGQPQEAETIDPNNKVSLTKAKNNALALVAVMKPKLEKIKTIASEKVLEEVGEIRLALKRGQTAWVKMIKPSIDALNVLKKNLTELKGEVDDDYKESIEIADNLLAAYAEEKRRIALEEQVKRDKEAMQLQMRAAAKLKTAALTTSARQRDRIETQAAELQVRAEELTDTPVLVEEDDNFIDIPVIECEVYSIRELIRHIAMLESTGGADLTSLLKVNTTELNALMKLEEPTPGIGTWLPGVEVKQTTIIRSRKGSLQ
jgi:hypothetical protein